MNGPNIAVVQASPIQNPNFGVRVPAVLQHRPMADRPAALRVVPPADMFDANVVRPLQNFVPGTPEPHRTNYRPWDAWTEAWRVVGGRLGFRQMIGG